VAATNDDDDDDDDDVEDAELDRCENRFESTLPELIARLLSPSGFLHALFLSPTVGSVDGGDLTCWCLINCII